MLLSSLQVAGSSLELNCFSLIVCDCFLMVIYPDCGGGVTCLLVLEKVSHR